MSGAPGASDEAVGGVQELVSSAKSIVERLLSPPSSDHARAAADGTAGGAAADGMAGGAAAAEGIAEGTADESAAAAASAASQDANVPESDVDVAEGGEGDDELCPVCLELPSEPRPWKAGCGHIFCPQCEQACLARSLRCPMCRAEAPASTRPIDRAQLLLTALQLARLRELERLRTESGPVEQPRREPRTRIGRWASRRANAINSYVDSLLD